MRSRRVAPGRDDKIIVAWNGLMISAMAQAYGRSLGNRDYLESARAAATFMLDRMRVDGEAAAYLQGWRGSLHGVSGRLRLSSSMACWISTKSVLRCAGSLKPER